MQTSTSSIAGLLVLLGGLSGTPVVHAAECRASSGDTTVALLELYTSEGCSSCPPADRWLSSLSQSGIAPQHVVPLALHVDYWDSIGWKDRFASPTYTRRQHALAASGRSRFVYTPQVVLNGRDYRGWGREPRFSQDIAAINARPARAQITLAVRPFGNALQVDASAQAPGQARAVLYLALYENALTSEVKAGENSGATLHHDRVVRHWLGPLPLQQALTRQIELAPEWKRGDLGVAAFVQDSGGEILQALSLPACAA